MKGETLFVIILSDIPQLNEEALDFTITVTAIHEHLGYKEERTGFYIISYIENKISQSLKFF